MRVFKLAKEHGIKRIILTSSVASIWMDSTIEDTVRYIDESNWTDPMMIILMLTRKEKH